MSVRAFYDDLAPWYHLIFQSWEVSVARQGAQLESIIRERWGESARLVLDAAVGIGTQALGLAARGFRVVGSDLAPAAASRAHREASQRGLVLPCHAADFRALAIRPASVDVVLVADNALPHMEDERQIEAALAELHRCARPGGGLVLSMRDYGTPPADGTVETHPYGERVWEGRRYQLRQVWTWHGPRYDVTMELVAEGSSVPKVAVTTTYLAIRPARVAELMRAVGFADVERLDGRFFQPVLVGTRA